MVLLINQRVPLVAVLEIVFAGIVSFLACAITLSGLGATIVDAGDVAVGVPASAYALVQVISILAFGLHRMERVRSVTQFVVRMAGSLAVGGAFSYVALAGLEQADTYRAALPVALAMSAIGLGVVRVALMTGVQMGILNHRILVLGVGQEALAVDRCLRDHAQSGVTIAGFFPVGNGTREMVDAQRVMRAYTSLEECIAALDIHEVVVAVRDQRGGQLPVEALLNSRLSGIRVTTLSDFFERVTGEVPVDSLKASWMIYGDGFRQGIVRRFVKRAFDLVASSVLLAVAAPIMVLTAIAIRLESSGPVIFRQERVGLGGRTFEVLKFRSMRTDAEKDGIPRWATSGDPRVTRVGRFIRKTRIDELPQIFNVLKGDMSFVGPRPERPYFVSQLSGQIPFYGVRHTVKPGVTGWAQVRYSYGASVDESMRKLQFDLYYVKNHSIYLDLVILLHTVRVVLRGEGAR